MSVPLIWVRLRMGLLLLVRCQSHRGCRSLCVPGRSGVVCTQQRSTPCLASEAECADEGCMQCAPRSAHVPARLGAHAKWSRGCSIQDHRRRRWAPGRRGLCKGVPRRMGSLSAVDARCAACPLGNFVPSCCGPAQRRWGEAYPCMCLTEASSTRPVQLGSCAWPRNLPRPTGAPASLPRRHTCWQALSLTVFELRVSDSGVRCGTSPHLMESQSLLARPTPVRSRPAPLIAVAQVCGDRRPAAGRWQPAQGAGARGGGHPRDSAGV